MENMNPLDLICYHVGGYGESHSRIFYLELKALPFITWP